jgi:hypothetical protein
MTKTSKAMWIFCLAIAVLAAGLIYEIVTDRSSGLNAVTIYNHGESEIWFHASVDSHSWHSKIDAGGTKRLTFDVAKDTDMELTIAAAHDKSTTSARFGYFTPGLEIHTDVIIDQGSIQTKDTR